jgi:5'-methylthioadenosine/S-adenosylhomocysteine nucleosidase
MTGDQVVVLTAFNTEYQAVRQRLVDLRAEHERGTRFEVGTLRGTRCRVALGLTGKGNHAAGILAERAIQRYSPMAVLFVGVAGALWDTAELGDVVVATHVYAYHGGTSDDDGLKTRPRVWELDHGVAQIAAHVARAVEWTDAPTADRRAPKVHFGPIAAGEVVHNSHISYEARLLRDGYNDALAVEMEGAGVAQAGHLSGSPVVVVRGISDRADGTKTSGADRDWQPRAAANAAAFAARLTEQLITERERSVSHEARKGNGRAVAHNTSSGTVGIQAAHVVNSNVWMGATLPSPSPADLAAALVSLREQLARERSTGALDEPTYQAARAELDHAEEALEEAETHEGRSRFVLALKRLRGLIEHVTDLATKIAGLITTVNELT